MKSKNEPPHRRADGVSCERYRLDEVRSVRKLFNCGVYYHVF
jgi:hypothetical protein